MKQRKRNIGARRVRAGDVRKRATQFQPDYSTGIGPLRVGTKTVPGDLDVHFELISREEDPGQARTAVGLRLRLSKMTLVVILIGMVMVSAALRHDRRMVSACLDFFKSLTSAGVPLRAARR